MDLEDYDMELDLNLAYLNKYVEDSDEEIEQEEDEEEEETDVIDLRDNQSSLRQADYSSEEDDEFEDSNEASLVDDDNRSHHEISSGFNTNGLEACLVSNQIYQEYVIDVISQLESALQANKEKQDQLQDDLYAIVNDETYDSKSQRFPRTSKFLAAPYFRDENDFFCTKNEDYEIKKVNNELENYTFAPVLWVNKDREALRKAVKTMALKGLLEPLMERKQNLMSKWESERGSVINQFLDPEDGRLYLETYEAQMNPKIKQIDDEIVKISNYPDKMLFSDEILKLDIDWYHISINTILNKHSDVSCRLMWKYFVNPCVNNDKWTGEEEDKLRELVEEYEAHDWDFIAGELETGRSPLACFLYFHNTLCKTPMRNVPWTKASNEKLVSLVNRYTVNGNVIWSQIFQHFPNRDHLSLKKHYNQISKNDVQHGAFSIAEDLLIFLCHLKYGRRFTKYVQHVPNRSSHQIGTRFRESIEYRLVTRFTHEDDQKLIRLLKLRNCNWNEVIKEFPGRLMRQLRSRFKIILTYAPGIMNKNIEDPDFIWPNINSTASRAIFTRRVYFCNYIRAKLEWFKKHGRDSRRHFSGPQSLKKYYPKQYVEECDIEVPRISVVDLDFMISEVSIICRNSLKDERKKRGQTKRTNETIDAEINQYFNQSFHILNFNPKRSRLAKMYGGFREAQYNASCNTLHRALGVKRVALPLPKTEDNRVENGDDSEEEIVYASKRVLKLQEEQLEFATRIVRETCYDLKVTDDINNEKYPKSVLQPMLDVLESFQILVTDRNRLGRMAMGISTPEIVYSIIGKSPLTCPTCKYREGQPSASSESGVKSEFEKCFCEDLIKSRHAYNYLRRRFFSLFFWSGFLSILPPPVEELISTEEMDEIESRKCKYIVREKTVTGKLVKAKTALPFRKHLNSTRMKAAMNKINNLRLARVRNGLSKKRPNEDKEPEIAKPPPKKRKRYVPPPDIVVRKSSRLNK